MTTPSKPYRGFRFLAEVIQHAAWLYHCFSLSLTAEQHRSARDGAHRTWREVVGVASAA